MSTFVVRYRGKMSGLLQLQHCKVKHVSLYVKISLRCHRNITVTSPSSFFRYYRLNLFVYHSPSTFYTVWYLIKNATFICCYYCAFLLYMYLFMYILISIYF